MPIKLNTASGGGVILQGANTASDKTITVPAVDGTMITTASTFAGTGPAFSAYQSSAQSIANGTATKLQLQSEYWDTASCFDSTTNYRFTPNVAGYYQVNGNVLFSSATATVLLMLYKNGSFYQKGSQSGGAGSYSFTASISTSVYLNGSTDYVELYAYQASGGSLNTNANSAELGCVFNGFLARAA